MGGSITETEAYTEDDPASHTFRGKTVHNQSMFELPATAYVYRSYGIHYCLNVSTGAKDRGEAVLIRAMDATFGTASMVAGASPGTHRLCSGPGRLCAALKIDKSFDGQLLGNGDLAIFRAPSKDPFQTAVGPRIGISKAMDFPWRFGVANHPSLSKPFRKVVVEGEGKGAVEKGKGVRVRVKVGIGKELGVGKEKGKGKEKEKSGLRTNASVSKKSKEHQLEPLKTVKSKKKPTDETTAAKHGKGKKLKANVN